jgi:carbonic anhydrase
LAALLSKIQPAVYAEKTITENLNSDSEEFVEKVAAIMILPAAKSVFMTAL